MKPKTHIEKIKSCIKSRKICRFSLYIPLELFYLALKLRVRLTPDRSYISKRYARVFRHKPDFENPATMNEYLAYRKLYDRDPLLPLCSDKYRVRRYVADKIGEEHLVPLLMATDDPDTIDFSKLPDRFVIKVNHGSGQNIIVTDKTKIDTEETRVLLHYWMKRSHYYNNREWQYKEIKPMVIIEEMLLDSDGHVPKDYKFHVFGGKVEMINIDTDRFEKHRRIFYSPKWEKLDFLWVPDVGNNQPKYEESDPQPKPENLDEMIRLAEKLAEDFLYVRVDFYNLRGKIYFGELTFTHENGLAKFFPEKYDAIYGEKIRRLREGRK